jgi:hypothetical protein
VFFNLKADATVTTVTSAPNPSLAGEAVTFTVTVTAPNAGFGAPPFTGTVTLFEGPTPLASATISPAGGAAFTLSTLAVGPHALTAVYSGSPITPGSSPYQASSGAVTQQVNQIPTTTALAAAPNPTLVGQPVTFTATVTPSATTGLVPTGTVTFFDGTTPIGSAPVASNGVAALTVSNLVAGAHTITASYSGDVSFQTSTSGPVAQQVNQIPSRLRSP